MKVRVRVNLQHVERLKENLKQTNITSALDDTLSEVAEMWIEDAHVITGFMQSRIEWRTVTNFGRVFCTAEYAIAEVERGGDHDFTARGLAAGPEILRRNMEALLQ